jgi:hypothetical protein
MTLGSAAGVFPWEHFALTWQAFSHPSSKFSSLRGYNASALTLKHQAGTIILFSALEDKVSQLKEN